LRDSHFLLLEVLLPMDCFVLFFFATGRQSLATANLRCWHDSQVHGSSATTLEEAARIQQVIN